MSRRICALFALVTCAIRVNTLIIDHRSTVRDAFATTTDVSSFETENLLFHPSPTLEDLEQLARNHDERAISTDERHAVELHKMLQDGDMVGVANFLLYTNHSSNGRSPNFVIRGSTSLSLLLRSWSQDLSNSWPEVDTSKYIIILHYLLKNGANSRVGCPLLDAVATRNALALQMILNAHYAAPDKEAPSDIELDETAFQAIQDCILSAPDHQNIFFSAATTSSLAIARLYFRGGQAGIGVTTSSNHSGETGGEVLLPSVSKLTHGEKELIRMLQTQNGVRYSPDMWPIAKKTSLEVASAPSTLKMLLKYLPSLKNLNYHDNNEGEGNWEHLLVKPFFPPPTAADDDETDEKEDGFASIFFDKEFNGDFSSIFPSSTDISADDMNTSGRNTFTLSPTSSLHAMLTQWEPQRHLTPFLQSCLNGRLETLRILLHSVFPSNVSHMSDYFHGGPLSKAMTCAHLAASQGYTSILQLLVDTFGEEDLVEGAEGVLTSKDSEGRTPCDLALVHGPIYASAITLLYKVGACNTTTTTSKVMMMMSLEELEKSNFLSLCPSPIPGTITTTSYRRNHNPHDSNRDINAFIASNMSHRFDAIEHVQRKWRLLSPDQLEELGLPRTLLVPKEYEGNSSNDYDHDDDDDSSVTFHHACKITEVSSAGIEHRRSIEKELMSTNRPFIVRNAYNRFERNFFSPHDDGAEKTVKNNYNNDSAIPSITEVLYRFGSLHVDTGKLPYAKAYGHPAGASNMPLRDFIEQFMGRDRVDVKQFTPTLSPTPLTLSERTDESLHINEGYEKSSVEILGSGDLSYFEQTLRVLGTKKNQEHHDNDNDNDENNSNNNNIESEIYHAAIMSLLDGSAYKGPGDNIQYPPYVFDAEVLSSEEGSETVADFAFPLCFGKDENSARQFIVGSGRSGAMMHFHAAAVNLLLVGVKLWVFEPPSQAAFIDAPAASYWKDFYLPVHGKNKKMKMNGNNHLNNNSTNNTNNHNHPTQDVPWHYVVIQGPGDIVYVPLHWGHAVLNLADTVAVAYE